MIGRLTGIVDLNDPDIVLVDVSGVGYLVQTSSRTSGSLVQGERATLLVETQVREDSITLFGFADRRERDWFRLLTGVQSVGGRVALSLLSVLGPDELPAAVASGDRKALSRADGVGPKLAARIANELKDKMGSQGLPAASDGTGAGADEEAVSALVNLGYGRAEAFGAVAGAKRRLGAEAGLDDLIRAGLGELAR